MKSKYLYTVCTQCFTYNQAAYIKDALQGFTIQKAKFPMAFVVVDDASTDGEPELLRQWANENLFPIEGNDLWANLLYGWLAEGYHNTQPNATYAILLLNENHYGKKSKLSYLSKWFDSAKYMAYNEGDDYWTDSSKLQKQFDLMEENPNMAICFHSNYELWPDGTMKIHRPQRIKDITIDDAILGGGGYMSTNSMFTKYDLLVREGKPIFWKDAPVGDLPTMLFYASKGEIGYIDDTMSVYRVSSVGSWTSRQSTFAIRTTHYKRVRLMWDEFDEYTSFKHHKTIIKKKRINRHIHYKDVIRTVFLSLLPNSTAMSKS